jgi:hypothetical protein
MEIEVIGDVPFRNDERVQTSDGMLVENRNRKFPIGDYSGFDVTETAPLYPMVVALGYATEICVVSVSLGGVAAVAQCLKI